MRQSILKICRVYMFVINTQCFIPSDMPVNLWQTKKSVLTCLSSSDIMSDVISCHKFYSTVPFFLHSLTFEIAIEIAKIWFMTHGYIYLLIFVKISYELSASLDLLAFF